MIGCQPEDVAGHCLKTWEAFSDFLSLRRLIVVSRDPQNMSDSCHQNPHLQQARHPVRVTVHGVNQFARLPRQHCFSLLF